MDRGPFNDAHTLGGYSIHECFNGGCLVMGEQDVLDSFFEEEFIIKLTGFTKKTVDNHRSSGSSEIPPSRKLGRRWVYPKREYAEWAKKKGIPVAIR